MGPRILGNGVVSDYRIRVVAAINPAVRILGNRIVLNHRIRVVAAINSAAEGCRIACDDIVPNHWGGVVAINPATGGCRIAYDDIVLNRRGGVVAINPATTSIPYRKPLYNRPHSLIAMEIKAPAISLTVNDG